MRILLAIIFTVAPLILFYLAVSFAEREYWAYYYRYGTIGGVHQLYRIFYNFPFVGSISFVLFLLWKFAITAVLPFPEIIKERRFLGYMNVLFVIALASIVRYFSYADPPISPPPRTQPNPIRISGLREANVRKESLELSESGKCTYILSDYDRSNLDGVSTVNPGEYQLVYVLVPERLSGTALLEQKKLFSRPYVFYTDIPFEQFSQVANSNQDVTISFNDQEYRNNISNEIAYPQKFYLYQALYRNSNGDKILVNSMYLNTNVDWQKCSYLKERG